MAVTQAVAVVHIKATDARIKILLFWLRKLHMQTTLHAYIITSKRQRNRRHYLL